MSKLSRNRGSSEGAKQPHAKISFWMNPKNHFWETDAHTEKSKEYHRQRIQDMFHAHRNQATI